MRFGPALVLAALSLHCGAFGAESPLDSVSDAGMSVSPDGGGGGASFCARARSEANVAFCDDFDMPDRTAMDMGGWGVVPPSPGATVVSEGCFSPPRCARIVFPTGGQPHSVSVATVAFPSKAKELRLRLRMRAESGYGLGASSGLPAFGLSLWGDFNCKVLFYPSSGIWLGCPGNGIIAPGPIAPSSTWSLVTMTVRKGDAGSSVDVRVEVGEGAGAVSKSVSIPAQAKPLGDTVGLFIGQREREGAGTVAFDDVVVNVD